MSMPTFFLDEGFSEDGLITLSGKEAWHALGVRRLDAGDSIRLIEKAILRRLQLNNWKAEITPF